MKMRVGYTLILLVISLTIIFGSLLPLEVHGVSFDPDAWWDEDWPYRLRVMVDGDGVASVSVDFSQEFSNLGLGDALLDVRSIRVVPYRDGMPGEPIPYEETYSTLLVDGESLNRDPDSGEPYWVEEDLFTLERDSSHFTQGESSVHAKFEHRPNGSTWTGFGYEFNNDPTKDWSDYEVIIYDVLPEVNDSAVDQSPDLFFFELNGLSDCPIDWVNGPALVMDDWNSVSVSLKPFGSCSVPDASDLANIRFYVRNTMPYDPGYFGEGDVLDLWLDNFRLVDQDGDGEIRWETEADVNTYYIYFDTLNHEGHPPPDLREVGTATVSSTLGTAEAGGYLHQITGAETSGLSIWTAPIEEKIFHTNTTPVSFKPLRISAARGEMEAFQIVVNSPTSRQYPVEISNLVHEESGVIPASQVDLFRVDYVNITKISDYYGRLGPWPDPLYPVSLGDSIDFPAGENQPLWFRVRVPSNAKAGIYSGEIHIGPAKIPITLEVWDFYLSQSLYPDVIFGLDWDTVIEAYGGMSGDVKDECYANVKGAFETAFDDYHITPTPADSPELPSDAVFYTLTTYEVEAAHALQTQDSTPVWWQVKGSDQLPFPNPIVMDGLGVDAHVLPWMAWLNRLDGIYIAQSSDWYPDPWVTPYWESMCNGDGFFFYSPKDDGLAFDPCDAASNRLVPSIRLELFREGLEDAAYLRLLTGHAPEIDVTNPGDEFAMKLITSRTAFNRVPTVVSSLRSQMAGLLQGKGGNSYFFPLILH
ncbi:MAG: DUF4091 domain-containing protein [Chloroflexota bacterium]|jgi:hypothetical protein|nr:DUF4091 domain-containing protein [Chloroflexota bacterium]